MAPQDFGRHAVRVTHDETRDVFSHELVGWGFGFDFDGSPPIAGRWAPADREDEDG